MKVSSAARARQFWDDYFEQFEDEEGDASEAAAAGDGGDDDAAAAAAVAAGDPGDSASASSPAEEWICGAEAVLPLLPPCSAIMATATAALGGDRDRDAPAGGALALALELGGGLGALSEAIHDHYGIFHEKSHWLKGRNLVINHLKIYNLYI